MALRDEVVSHGKCSTEIAIYIDADASILPDSLRQNGTAIIKYRGYPESYKRKIEITNCGLYLVFKLPEVEFCHQRYCAA